MQEVFSILAAVLALGLIGWLKFRRDKSLVSRLLQQSEQELSSKHRRKRLFGKEDKESRQRSKADREQSE